MKLEIARQFALVCLTLLLFSPAAAQPVYQSPEHGFRVTPPAGWTFELAETEFETMYIWSRDSDCGMAVQVSPLDGATLKQIVDEYAKGYEDGPYKQISREATTVGSVAAEYLVYEARADFLSNRIYSTFLVVGDWRYHLFSSASLAENDEFSRQYLSFVSSFQAE